MTNAPLFKAMIDQYNALAFTHNYIFGFEDGANVLAVIADNSVLPYALTLDRASTSHGGTVSLRFKPTTEQKNLLKCSGQAFVLCSKAYLEAVVAETKYNRGEVFEKLITEFYGQEWHKDNVPFTKGGDLTVDGIAFQVKYNKATFTNESTLRSLFSAVAH